MKSNKPVQRLSYSEKIANDNAWGKENIDYYISCSNFYYLGTQINGRDIQMLYDIYNNKFPESWFHFVKNPLNSTRNEFKNFPARLREYTILRPNVDLFIGEYSKRPFTFQVINAAHEAWNSFLEQKKELLKKNVTQHFINFANKLGVDTGEDTQNVQPPNELIEQFVSSYKDLRALQGQAALKVIEEENSVRELLRDLFKDWMIAGEVYTYKGIKQSDIDYERVSPIECDYDKSNTSKYIEDGEWFTRRRLTTFSDLLDKIYDEATEEELDKIEKRFGLTPRAVTGIPTMFTRLNSMNREDLRSKVELIHVTWKSQDKIGILSYPDPVTGEMQEMEVDEDYKVDKKLGETIKWYWVNRVWEGYRVDGDLYFGIRPIPVQRNKMNRYSYCKLPYNGRRFSDVHSTNLSPLELGIPFQIMHIILKYRLELTIAKNKGKIALIDQNVIPRKPGWDEEKFLYYSEALGWGFIDRNQVGVDKSFNQYQVLDLTLFEHIEQVLKLIDNNKKEWDEVLGINPYRKGQTQASDAVTNVQQGIFQSSVISDIVFSSFEDFVKTEYKGLLDMSKFAWIDGKKKLYRTDDMRTAILDIDPEDYLESEFDIFVTNSTKEYEKLNMLKGAAQAFAQNQNKPSMIAEIIGAESFAEVKQTLQKLEAMEQQLVESQAQNEQEAEKQKLAITQEYEQMKEQFEIDKMEREYQLKADLMEKEYDRKEDLEYIVGDVAIETYQGSDDVNGNGIPDINEIQKRAVEREKISHESYHKGRELDIKERELRLKHKEVDTKAKAEKHKVDTQLKIARLNSKKKVDSKK